MEAAQVRVMFHIDGVEDMREAAKLLDTWLQSAEDDDRLVTYFIQEFMPATPNHSHRV